MEHGGSQIYYAKDGTLYAGGMPNIMRSTNNGATWTMVAPTAGYIGVIGDGTNLYAKAHDRSLAIVTGPETTGTPWVDYDPNPPTFMGGAYEFDMDHEHRVVYGAFLNAGLLALKLR